jgi:pimeloyl-ACP methyl ester carboxylesterase
MHIGDGQAVLSVRSWPGTGRPALLIHGIGSSAASWTDLVPLLQPYVRPIAIDLRGHGDSGRPATGYLYDDYIADLDRIIEAMGLDCPVLIGHSLGGIVALWWAAKHPDAAGGVIAIDSPLRSGEEFRPAFDRWIAENAMPVEELSAAYLAQHPEWSPEQARRRATIMTGTAPGVFAELKQDSLRHHGADRIDELTGIQSPILLVRGEPEAGSMVHPADAETLVNRLPAATVEVIAQGSHTLHRQFPDTFVAAAARFLQRNGLT